MLRFMPNYTPTIGLEVHVELKTKTKMFCDSLNDPDEKHPNVNVCPVCLGHPGTLPTINKKAVEYVIKVGLAIGAKINPISHFDRKNYFYPDLPKGYQISQSGEPIVGSGTYGGVRINHIHLEEDAGRLVHQASRANDSRIESNESRIFENDSISFDKYSGESGTLVDFNRAGVPLMELVTEPDMHSAEDAVSFMKEIQLLLRYIGVSDADLERGQMRADANVSVARSNDERMETNSDRIVLKDESYRLMGLLFEIHNKLGPVYKEKHYQDAIEEILKREKISYEREKKLILQFENLPVDNFFADFIVDGKILLEVKATKNITQEDIRQVLRYLRSADVPLGIIVNFRSDKLESKRLVNPTFEKDSALFDSDSSEPLGTRCEVKNLNSFRSVASAIAYEIKRQTEVLDSGAKVRQETRGWDEAGQKTTVQRSKEHAHDYRYFPEPDLPPFETSAFNLEDLKRHLPELPRARQARFVNEFGLQDAQAKLLIENKPVAEFFEAAVSEFATRDEDTSSKLEKEPQELLFNYLTSDLLGLTAEFGAPFEDIKINPEEFAHLVDLIADGKIMSRQAKDILRKMFETGEDPETILNTEGLHTVSDEGELGKTIEEVIAENPTAVADYKKGKTASLQFLIGQAMQKMRGKANPEVLKRLFTEKLS